MELIIQSHEFGPFLTEKEPLISNFSGRKLCENLPVKKAFLVCVCVCVTGLFFTGKIPPKCKIKDRK
jgi:hypothetical protein